ncbi:hypothetical protein BOX15_Mlig030341g2, partial [Macrostomum lignano]
KFIIFCHFGVYTFSGYHPLFSVEIMDQTARPLQIPPTFALYAEKHNLFDLYHDLISQLLIHKPADPVQFLIESLEKDNARVSTVMVLGPPASGKHTIGKMLAGRLRCPHLTMQNMIPEVDRKLRQKAEFYLAEKQPIPTELWTSIVKNRLSIQDCNRKGWVMSGFPQTRDQAVALQTAGVIPDHVIFLEAKPTVLAERAIGKRWDPETGDIYHLVFDQPTDDDVLERLVECPGNSESEINERIREFEGRIIELAPCYSNVGLKVNADQPVADVFHHALEFVSSPRRSSAPRNPRVILIGPPGSGRDTQAALLAAKYGLVNLNCGQLIKQAISGETKAGGAMKNYVDRGMPVPDAILLKLLKERLCQLDCVTRGWVLHGYPRTRGQAEQLADAGFQPNRVFFMELGNAQVLERLTNRMTDPVTGRRYQSLYDPPTDAQVKERLVQHPRDTEAEVNRRLSRYSTFREELRDFYASKSLSLDVNCDQDVETVFETLESHIVSPLPKNFD